MEKYSKIGILGEEIIDWEGMALDKEITPKIVAIGGGEISDRETKAIDERIIELTGETEPRALFIPTASDDSRGYIDIFEEYYGRHLGCETSILKLTEDPPPFDIMFSMVVNADLIYVGGGNTVAMMRRWRRLELDSALLEAASRGVVLAGLSAGAICWFKYGHSDPRSFYGNSKWDNTRVKGLGFVNATYCPHYHFEKREAGFLEMLTQRGGIGIACDNNTAIEIVGEYFRILTSAPTGKAYKIFRNNKNIYTIELPETREYMPLADLLSRREDQSFDPDRAMADEIY